MANAARRLVFRAIKEVDWEPLALPTELQPTEVLVRTARTVISAGTEIAVLLRDAHWLQHSGGAVSTHALLPRLCGGRHR